MRYWNQSRFERLSDLANDLATKEHCEPFAEYCRLKEKGLRKDATKSLDRFIQLVLALPETAQRHIADELMTIQFRDSPEDRLLPQPLLARFIEPLLEQWHAEQPDDKVPLRWLGILQDRPAHLKMALAIDAADTLAVTYLVKLHLEAADYATHHLGDGYFIGDEANAVDRLREAGTLLAGCEAGLQGYRDWHQELSSLVDDWLAYRSRPEGTFREWCEKNGKRHAWTLTVPYVKK